jgi:hypothetical protein
LQCHSFTSELLLAQLKRIVLLMVHLLLLPFLASAASRPSAV